jgi:pimeloyl-ACP methyl ester carboxylesterase
MGSIIQQAVRAIIRPRRYGYDPDDLPSVFSVYTDEDPVYSRHPLRIQNPRHQTLVGSVYHHHSFNPSECGRCVLYLHGNASCQLEGQFLVPNFCPHGVLVGCVDFCGCGSSDGDYISLGYWEKEDVEHVMSELAVMFRISQFFLWGRSMGASTALMVRAPLLKGVVADSAYTSVADLCTCIARSKSSVPAWLTPSAVWILSKRVKSTAGFNLYDVRPIEYVVGATVPAVFGHAPLDDFVPFAQGRLLFEKYSYGDKLFFTFESGTHNSRRPRSWIRLCVCFALQKMGVPADDHTVICEARMLQGGDFHFTSLAALANQQPETGEAEEDEDV